MVRLRKDIGGQMQSELGESLPASFVRRAWGPEHLQVYEGSPVTMVVVRMERAQQDVGGMGNPYDAEDLNFFYASTTITVGNGAKTPFWTLLGCLGANPRTLPR